MTQSETDDYLEACKAMTEVLDYIRESFFEGGVEVGDDVKSEISKHPPGETFFHLGWKTIQVDPEKTKVIGRLDTGDITPLIKLFTCWLMEHNIQKNDYTQGTVNELSLLGAFCGYFHHHHVVVYMAYDTEVDGIRPPCLFAGLGHESGYCVKIRPGIDSHGEDVAPVVH